MTVYGTALLAACHLLGIVLGDLLGRALGMKSNVGGVGLAMMLLILVRAWLHQRGRFTAAAESGMTYWGAIYIPVVVAMAMAKLPVVSIFTIEGATTAAACLKACSSAASNAARS